MLNISCKHKLIVYKNEGKDNKTLGLELSKIKINK